MPPWPDTQHRNDEDDESKDTMDENEAPRLAYATWEMGLFTQQESEELKPRLLNYFKHADVYFPGSSSCSDEELLRNGRFMRGTDEVEIVSCAFV
uniref:BEACH domain-containing protein n=1 Tax=Steinernema glaseri TaxID=37863 RepID=A0A1I7YW24_9BILA